MVSYQILPLGQTNPCISTGLRAALLALCWLWARSKLSQGSFMWQQRWTVAPTNGSSLKGRDYFPQQSLNDTENFILVLEGQKLQDVKQREQVQQPTNERRLRDQGRHSFLGDPAAFLCLWNSYQWDWARLLNGVRGSAEDNGCTLEQEDQTRYKKELSPCEDRQAVVQTAQRGCAMLLLGGFQDPAGSRFEQADLALLLILLWTG